MNKRSNLILLAGSLILSALVLAGCEGNLRDKNEACREQGKNTASAADVKEDTFEAEVLEAEPEEEAVTEQSLTEPEEPAPSEAFEPESEPEPVEPEAVQEQPEVLEKYRELLTINPYVAGWLTIDDTVIDEPVVYTPGSQNYFLHRAIDGSDASMGTLFIAINWQEKNNHTLIYGHNMKDGTAFGSLLKFADEAYGRSHHLIRFDTLYEEREYELYGVFYSQIAEEELETEEDREQADKSIEENGVARKAEEGIEIAPEELTLNDIDLSWDFGDLDIFRQEKDEDNGRFRYYYYTDLSDPADFEYYARNVKERALYDMGIEAEWGDEFVTLSTCSYQVTNGRFVVVGIKKN
ncbi:MAG: class B sortase [Lachnospiraceae bacterium]|nr:class B sortase [Lachnospiraceae bacterium]